MNAFLTRHPSRKSLGLLLEQETGGADLHPVAVAQARAGNGLVVHHRLGPEGEVFQLEAAGHEVDGRVAAADAGVLEQVNLAIWRRPDVRGVAVEDELLAGDESLDHPDPAGLGRVLDDAGPEPGDDADG